MIGKLKSILMGDTAFGEQAESQEDRQQLALASLLVEMARADFDETHDEHSLIIDLLARHYDLSAAESLELLNKARAANNNAVCLFDFTRSLHNSLDAEQKTDVIRLLWQVANADNKLDKYEDYLVRKVGKSPKMMKTSLMSVAAVTSVRIPVSVIRIAPLRKWQVRWWGCSWPSLCTLIRRKWRRTRCLRPTQSLRRIIAIIFAA